MTTTCTGTYQHPCDEERVRLRGEVAFWQRRVKDVEASWSQLMDLAVERRKDRDILANKLQDETKRHAATIEECRALRAELAQAKRHWPGILVAEKVCSCVDPMRPDNPGCERHGALVRWEMSDG